MQDDAALVVEAQLRQAFGDDRLTTGEILGADFHGPTGVNIRPGNGDVVDLGLDLLRAARGFEQILLDRVDTDLGGNGVIEPGIRRIDVADIGSHVLLAEISIKRGEAGDRALGALAIAKRHAGAFDESLVVIPGEVGRTCSATAEQDSDHSGQKNISHA